MSLPLNPPCADIAAMHLPVVNLLANLWLAVLPHVLRKQHDAIPPLVSAI